VKIYDYTSRYAPEHYNGGYYQWLPSGSGGLQLTLFSDQPRRVVFQAEANAGPARKDTRRTLIMSTETQKISTPIDGQQLLQLDIDLKPGLNHIEFYVEEPSDNLGPAGPDARELMLLLVSPRLVPSIN
jgi:hypothetical protein